MPPSVQTLLDTAEAPFEYVTKEDPMAAVEAQELDLYVVFDADFESNLGAQSVPQVEIYYHSASSSSSTAHDIFSSLLNGYESMLANLFDVNADPEKTYDFASAEDATGMLFSMLMPMLLIMLMFSGCMAVAPESIAGEKERGTIATLLVTPIRRSELAIGKILALSIISLLSGLCSFLGVLLALPQLMGDEMGGMIDANIYQIGDYAWILGIILTTILVFVSLISVISALASSIKEATSMISPLMILVTLVGISGMFGGGGASWSYLIPVYNSVQCISGVFSLDYEPIHILITMLTNIAATVVFVFVLNKLFNSERIMFKK
jgi:sodium transport system permease protein